jgi:SAM-dependent methyltransferase
MKLLASLALAIVLMPAPRAAAQSADAAIYEEFRAWVSAAAQGDLKDEEVMGAYRKVLASNGLGAGEIDRRIRIIDEQGERLEIERWNRILTATAPAFNTQPNAFLVRMTRMLPRGTALDVGMGQGRNALYLAQQGWTVTGFDPADRAVAAAQAQADKLGVKLTTLVMGDEKFDFGRDRWDLVVLSYVSLRDLVARVHDSLKPGGMVVVEAFHRDSLKGGPIGSGVVFDTNELLKLFERFRVIQYEDSEDTGDFGLRKSRIVRLAAIK